jgi:hypothetical protein
MHTANNMLIKPLPKEGLVLCIVEVEVNFIYTG